MRDTGHTPFWNLHTTVENVYLAVRLQYWKIADCLFCWKAAVCDLELESMLILNKQPHAHHSRKDNYPFQSLHVSEGSLFATAKARLAMCKAMSLYPKAGPLTPAGATVAGHIITYL